MADAHQAPSGDVDEPLVERIQAAYDRRLDQVVGWIAGVEALARERPWLALGAAALAGWALAQVAGPRQGLYTTSPARRRRR